MQIIQDLIHIVGTQLITKLYKSASLTNIGEAEIFMKIDKAQLLFLNQLAEVLLDEDLKIVVKVLP